MHHPSGDPGGVLLCFWQFEILSEDPIDESIHALARGLRRRGRGFAPTANYPDAIDVGAVIGAAIRRGRAARASYEARDDASGSPKRPHVRRAHWHLYWTGQGRSTPRVKWISPIFVHSNGDAATTIRPVK